MGNEVVKKDILAQYVHDAADIEVRKHTLNQIRDALISTRNERLENIEFAVSLIDDKHESESQSMEYALKKIEGDHLAKVSSIIKKIKENEETIEQVKQKPYQERTPYSVEIFFLIEGFAIGTTAGVGLGTIIGGLLNNVALIIGITCFCAVIGVLISYKIDRKGWEVSCENRNNNTVETASGNIEKYKIELQEEEKRYEKELSKKKLEQKALNDRQLQEKAESENTLAYERKVYAELTEHIDILSGKIDTVDSQLGDFYMLNLIPQDYRSLECVIAFDQMFRNDLVDTMREAALLYEERVFRGEMIKGLDNIYKAINKLHGLMSETVSVLRNIQSNTNRMCDELVDVSSKLVRMNANVTGHLSTLSSNLSNTLDYIADSQSAIASELEYSRYANDAIRSNSDRMIWYSEQRRQGLL